MISRTPPHPLDPTHDPGLRSWIVSANVADTDFPIQNLPLGVFAEGADDPGLAGVALPPDLFHELASVGIDLGRGGQDMHDGRGAVHELAAVERLTRELPEVSGVLTTLPSRS